MDSKELPTSSHHAALDEMLYNAIKSNNIQAITNSFNNLSCTADVAVNVISQTYENVQLKNIPLSTDTQYLVESKLLDLLFISQYNNKVKNSYLDVRNHLNFTCELISSFVSKYYHQNDFEVDMEFIFHSRHIAQHLSVLKRNMNYSYEILPWEEMQFYTVMYLKTLTSSDKVYVTFKLLIHKQGFVQYLYHFKKTLLKVQEKFKEGDLMVERSNRGNFKKSVLRRTPEFEELYNDFFILRDIYSLEKIVRSIDNALIVDIEKDIIVARLTIERSLQVIGEYIKDSPDSPNLSEDLYKSLSRAAPRHLKPILIRLRNMLSHASTLNRKLALEDSKNYNFFKNIQEDLRKIKSNILYMSYKLKIEAVKKFLKRLLEMTSIEAIKRTYVGIDLEVVRPIKDNLQEFAILKNSIVLLCLRILDQTDQDKDLIADILTLINNYETKIKLIAHQYVEGINRVFKVLRTHNNLHSIKNIIRTYLKTLSVSEPKSSLIELGHKLSKLIQKFEMWTNQNRLESAILNLSQYQTHLIREENLGADRIELIYMDIFMYISLRIPNIQWIGEMDELLTPIGKVMETEKEVKEIFLRIERKLSDEDASYLRSKIETAQQQHFIKEELVEALQDPEDFMLKLKALNLSSDKLKQIVKNYKAPKFDKVKMIELIKNIHNVYGGLLKNLPDILPPAPFINYLKTFYENLKVKKSVLNQLPHAIEESTYNHIKLCYSKRLLTLKVVLDRFDLETNSEYLVSSLEMIVLDLLELLDDVDMLGNDSTLLVRKCPILRGKQLRNYLAHGDALMDILPCNPLIAVQFCARKLWECGESILDQRRVILIGSRSLKENFSENFNKCVEIIGKQQQLFQCARKGSIRLFENLVEAGKDSLRCSNYTGWNVLHYALSGRNFLLFQHLSKNLEEQTGYELLHMATAMGNIEIMDFLINNKQLDINKKLEDTLLNVALIHKYPDAAFYLLNQGISLEIKGAQGKTPLHWAAEKGYSEIAERIIYLHPDIINLRTDEGLTALNLACRFGHIPIVKQLLKTDTIGECFQEAAAYGHDALLIYFLKEHIIKEEDFGKAVKLASENGYWPATKALFREVLDEDVKHRYITEACLAAVTYGHAIILTNLLQYDIDLRGENFLHVASQNGHLDVIDTLLQAGSPLNTPMGHEQRAPLHWACCSDNILVVELLLSHPEIEINIRDKEQKTPLQLAVQNGHHNIVSTLIDNRADPHLTSNNGFTALHLATLEGNLETVDLLVNICSVDINSVDNINNETALIIAALNGFKDIVELLLKAGADLTCKTKKNGLTAFIAAVSRGHADVVIAFLKYKANLIDDSDDNGLTALHYAAHKNYNDIADILIKHKANVNLTNKTERIALHLAVQSGNITMVKRLINAGSDLHTAAEGKFSPLFLATIHGHFGIVQVLLQNGVEIEAESLNCVAAIQKMVELSRSKPFTGIMPYLKIFRLFEERGARWEEKKTDEMWPAIHLVAKTGNIPAMQVFLKNPADLYAQNGIGANVFHVACEAGQESIIKMLIEEWHMHANIKSGVGATGLHFAAAHDHLKVVETLIDHYRVDVNTKADDGSTALHWASQSGNLSVIRMLIEKGADVNATDKRQVTPLHLISFRGDKEIAKELVLQGANVNADGHVSMPLHVAVINGHLDVAQILLQAGADVNRVTLHKKSCLHLAVQNNHKDLVRLLLEGRIDASLTDDLNFTALKLASTKGLREIIHIFNEFHVLN
ncbi:uncharacterized protein [Euwallacea similis]|uniref:uncharacterized protein n=1 Tax=Euwallacea similis TaxID=1736056 RepID=UPI00344CA08E